MFDRTFRFSRRIEMANVYQRVTKVLGTLALYSNFHITISKSIYQHTQADVVAFVNEYLLSTGPSTKRMLCVAQGLKHAQASEFSLVARSQPGTVFMYYKIWVLFCGAYNFFSGDIIIIDGSSQLPLQQWLQSSSTRTFWPNQYKH